MEEYRENLYSPGSHPSGHTWQGLSQPRAIQVFNKDDEWQVPKNLDHLPMFCQVPYGQLDQKWRSCDSHPGCDMVCWHCWCAIPQYRSLTGVTLYLISCTDEVSSG